MTLGSHQRSIGKDQSRFLAAGTNCRNCWGPIDSPRTEGKVMKLDRNKNPDGRGKYALLKLRNWPAPDSPDANAVLEAMQTFERLGILDWGVTGTESEFMVIRLKDRYAKAALAAYAREAVMDDVEYGGEIWELARRAGPASKWCKIPD